MTNRVVLHTCCGPCASACVPQLKADGYEVVMYFANSNIDTREEYEKRLAEARKLAAVEGVRLAAEPYDHDEWLREVAAGYECEPEKGARCARCFRYNLAKAAAFAAREKIAGYTTSLTVSPHKVSSVIFASAAPPVSPPPPSVSISFLPYDFKKKGGFLVSTRRAKELGLYRQSYCGCEFSRRQSPGVVWKIHHKAETVSTNLDARAGGHGDVFTADFQTAGRGRLDHKWESPPKTNLMMSAVADVAGLDPEHVATLPLVVGLAVVNALESLIVRPASLAARRPSFFIKWPNDVMIGGRKVAGILCERVGDRVIAGIGVNVRRQVFSSEIAARAVALEEVAGFKGSVASVRDAILRTLGSLYAPWRAEGFAGLWPEVAARDALKGKCLSVRQTDDDAAPVRGLCGGIAADGSLVVDGRSVYAGEAHVENIVWE